MKKQTIPLGFTLIEIIISMILISILFAGLTIFIKGPVDAYYSTLARAEMSQNSMVAFLNLKRELRLSLPNSIKVSPDGKTLEFIPAIAGARYRSGPGGHAVPTGPALPSCPASADPNSAGDDSLLSIGYPDQCFETIGAPDSIASASASISPCSSSIKSSDAWVAVFNLGDGISGADAYENGFGPCASSSNKAPIAAIANVASPSSYFIFLSSSATFPYDSPGHRFFVIRRPVTYKCEDNGNSIDLVRYTNYSQSSVSNPAILASTGISKSIVLRNIDRSSPGSCLFSYSQNSLTSKFGIAALSIRQKTTDGYLPNLIEASVPNVP